MRREGCLAWSALNPALSIFLLRLLLILLGNRLLQFVGGPWRKRPPGFVSDLYLDYGLLLNSLGSRLAPRPLLLMDVALPLAFRGLLCQIVNSFCRGSLNVDIDGFPVIPRSGGFFARTVLSRVDVSRSCLNLIHALGACQGKLVSR